MISPKNFVTNASCNILHATLQCSLQRAMNIPLCCNCSHEVVFTAMNFCDSPFVWLAVKAGERTSTGRPISHLYVCGSHPVYHRTIAIATKVSHWNDEDSQGHTHSIIETRSSPHRIIRGHLLLSQLPLMKRKSISRMLYLIYEQ